MLEKYPDIKITVIDTTVNTVLQGLVAVEAARMRQAGLSYEDLVKRIGEIKHTGRIFFTIANMAVSYTHLMELRRVQSQIFPPSALTTRSAMRSAEAL